MTSLQRKIRKRILDRARGVLQPIGMWDSCKGMVSADMVAFRMAQCLPGALEDYDLDHRTPLASYDLTNRSEVARAFAGTNYQWLRAGANRSKGAKV